MTNCPTCNSTHTVKKGLDQRKFGMIQRFKCVDCNTPFSIPLNPLATVTVSHVQVDNDISTLLSTTYKRSDDWIKAKTKATKFVVTSAQSNTEIDNQFLHSLELYCEHNDAELMIIPIRYKNPTSQQEDSIEHVYDEIIEDYLFENNIKIHPFLKVLGSLKVAATTENPLTGLAAITKGDSVIVGHNQLQMMTLPVQPEDLPVIMTTTGTISKKNYSLSKQGYKAEFNHSNSAVVVEIDGDLFHMRHLNFDGKGFYDLNNYYTEDDITEENKIHTIVTGDEHAIFACELVKEATYGKGGIVETLKPEFIVRHDVLDCYSISHHHKHNFLAKYRKHVVGMNSIEKELEKTMDYIADTTPSFSTSIIVSSNHNDHLTRWLNECDPKRDEVNAKFYHFVMFNMLSSIEENPESIPNPFEAVAHPFFKKRGCKTLFTHRTETLKFFDIEVAVHGDRGANGSRGSRDSFANIPSKSIIGHSHSPGIEKGCYQVGTSSVLRMEYNDGPSSWLNTHCLIYPNGKRQLINIIKGKWRA